MWIRPPIIESLLEAIKRVSPVLSIEGSAWEGESFWIECSGPVDLGALKGVERVEMLPKVAVEMFLHKGQEEMAARVPFDRQLLVMTRVGDAYEFGEPVEVELSVEGNRLLGKISPLPSHRKKGKLGRQESRVKGKEAAREASSRLANV